MKEKVLNLIEKIGKTFEKLDLLKISRKHGYIHCVIYYSCLTLIFALFLFFVSIKIFSYREKDWKLNIFQEKINSWQKNNFSNELKETNFQININSNIFNLSFIKQIPNMANEDINDNIHSFPSSFHFGKLKRVFFEILPKFLSNDPLLISKNSSPVCIQVQINNKKKSKILSSQQICGKEKIKGLRVNLLKIEEIFFFNMTCSTKEKCLNFCESKGYLYHSNYFIKDDLQKNTITCLSPNILSDICLVITKHEKEIHYDMGCYNGQAEKYIKYDKNDEKQNYINLYIRDSNDPYLIALDLGENGKVYELWNDEKMDTINVFLYIGGVILCLTLLFGIILFVKTRKYREIEMEEFNQHEMSSCSIKL